MLLDAGKLVEAEQFRKTTIHDKLIKFVSLDGTVEDEKKFFTLENNLIWFSKKILLNDPYEFKGMIIDSEKMEEAGYSKDIIDAYQKMFEFKDYGITCLSANSIDFLPMWAYYTNNHRGFCVEYDVIKKDCVHEVLYEEDRIKIASLIFRYKDAVMEALRTGRENIESIVLAKMLLQNLFMKAKSWEHEKEYRIVAPLNGEKGENIPINQLGMKANRIIAGMNCSQENIDRLDCISNSLGLGGVYKSYLHSDKYTLEIDRR